MAVPSDPPVAVGPAAFRTWALDVSDTAQDHETRIDTLELGGGGADDQTAAEVPITDAGGYFTGTDVEAALQELGASSGGGGSLPLFVVGNGAGSHTTTSTSWVDVVASTYDLTLTGVTAGDHISIDFNCTVSNNTAGANVYVTCAIAGVTNTAAPVRQRIVTANYFMQSTFRLIHVLASGEISAGSVTVKPRYKVSGGTGSVVNLAADDAAPIFIVQNLGQ